MRIRCLVLCALLVPALYAASPAGTAVRVLVLGFKSAQLNNVQDRIFREMLLRAIHERGYGIIPVMEIEEICVQGGAGRIRGVRCAEQADYCSRLCADVCVSGSIKRTGKGTGLKIRPGQTFICEAVVYMKRTGQCSRITRKVRCRGDMHGLFLTLSETLSAGIDDMLKACQ